jgi:hypothetical protein
MEQFQERARSELTDCFRPGQPAGYSWIKNPDRFDITDQDDDWIAQGSGLSMLHISKAFVLGNLY